MQKDDIERLWDLEAEKNKRLFKKEVSQDELHFTALDYNDEIIILRSKIQGISETGIIVIINPDRAEKDGELFQLIDLASLKLAIFTYNLSEEVILELLEIVEEPEESEDIEYVED
ncbi:MAG TPA: hypothetical protein VMV49_12915 [Candidatus Deferrimicrobium sp.]|nr:hypothetical protein [Candidatus Deferrimicrobium sp.]